MRRGRERRIARQHRTASLRSARPWPARSGSGDRGRQPQLPRRRRGHGRGAGTRSRQHVRQPPAGHRHGGHGDPLRRGRGAPEAWRCRARYRPSGVCVVCGDGRGAGRAPPGAAFGRGRLDRAGGLRHGLVRPWPAGATREGRGHPGACRVRRRGPGGDADRQTRWRAHLRHRRQPGQARIPRGAGRRSSDGLALARLRRRGARSHRRTRGRCGAQLAARRSHRAWHRRTGAVWPLRGIGQGRHLSEPSDRAGPVPEESVAVRGRSRSHVRRPAGPGRRDAAGSDRCVRVGRAAGAAAHRLPHGPPGGRDALPGTGQAHRQGGGDGEPQYPGSRRAAHAPAGARQRHLSDHRRSRRSGPRGGPLAGRPRGTERGARGAHAAVTRRRGHHGGAAGARRARRVGGRRCVGERRGAARAGVRARQSAAARRHPACGDGARRHPNRRSRSRRPGSGDGAQGAGRMALAPPYARRRARLLRVLLVHHVSSGQSAAGQLRRCQRVPRRVCRPPPAAGPAGHHDQLGRHCWRGLRGAPSRGRGVPEQAGLPELHTGPDDRRVVRAAAPRCVAGHGGAHRLEAVRRVLAESRGVAAIAAPRSGRCGVDRCTVTQGLAAGPAGKRGLLRAGGEPRTVSAGSDGAAAGGGSGLDRHRATDPRPGPRFADRRGTDAGTRSRLGHRDGGHQAARGRQHPAARRGDARPAAPGPG